jgi:hypothetical protein
VVLLVVLCMTVEEAMNEFVQIWKLVFADESLKPTERSSKLRSALEDLFKRHDISLNRRLLSPADNGCKGCVYHHLIYITQRILTVSFVPLYRNP